MNITLKQLKKIISEAMFSAPDAKDAAKQRAAQNMSQYAKHNLDVMLGDAKHDEENEEEDPPDEETLIQGHDLLDTLGSYESPFIYKDEQTGDSIKSSYYDVSHFDQEMQTTIAAYRKMQMVDEFENQYMPAEGTAIMSALYKIADTPGVRLFVTSVDENMRSQQTPGSEVVRNPEAFNFYAIGTDNASFSNEVGKALGIDFDGDDMDAIHVLLEKMAGNNVITNVPEGYQYSPEDAFLAWITKNNSNLKIYVDP